MRTRHHPRHKRAIAALIWLVGITVALVALLRPAPAPAGYAGGGQLVGTPAPDFAVRHLDGGAMRLSELAGRPVLVHFWATWCPSCQVEMPVLAAAYAAHRDRGLEILAVNAGEADVTVASFRRRYQLTFPILMDADGRVAQQYGVVSIPTTYFVDRGGVVRSQYVGPLQPEQLDEHLARILAGGDGRG